MHEVWWILSIGRNGLLLPTVKHVRMLSSTHWSGEAQSDQAVYKVFCWGSGMCASSDHEL